MRVLFLEDEEAIRGFVRINLKRNGMEVTEAEDGETALELAKSAVPPYDIALLDVMLPTISGFEVCEQLRQLFPRMGIIMLTAKSQEEDKIRGLELGADDYVQKPFSPGELIARLNALKRRMLPYGEEQAGGAGADGTAGGAAGSGAGEGAEGDGAGLAGGAAGGIGQAGMAGGAGATAAGAAGAADGQTGGAGGVGGAYGDTAGGAGGAGSQAANGAGGTAAGSQAGALPTGGNAGSPSAPASPAAGGSSGATGPGGGPSPAIGGANGSGGGTSSSSGGEAAVAGGAGMPAGANASGHSPIEAGGAISATPQIGGAAGAYRRPTRPGDIASGPFLLSAAERRLWKDNVEIVLTPTEWTLVKLLMEREGEGLSRDDILNAVWGRHYVGDLKIVDVNIRRIRQKIEVKPSDPKHIETLWGYGYRWNRSGGQ